MTETTTAPADVLITGATAITADARQPVIEDAIISVRGGKIELIGSAGVIGKPQAHRHLDLSGYVVTPGLVNVHTHTILTMVRGVAEDMGFAPAYTRGVPHGHEVSEGEAVALARLGALEAMLFGSTLINDSYVHAAHTLPAMGELGLRVIACGRIHDVDFSRVHEGVWEHQDEIGEGTLQAAIELFRRWHGKADGRLGVHLAAHAPDTCTRKLLADVASTRDRLGIRVNTHLSQSTIENERVQERDGCSPTELLADVGLLDHRLTAAHCMHVSDSDIDLIGRSGMTVAHVPKGNATGGVIAPTRKLRHSGARIALATDNMHADMVEVMRWALLMGRVQEARVNEYWQPEDVLSMATIEGARALGLEGQIGSLEQGKQADLVAFDLRRPHLVPNLDVLGNLVHTGQGRDVAYVLCNGEIVVEDGQPVFADTAAIMADAQQAADSLWQRARAEA